MEKIRQMRRDRGLDTEEEEEVEEVVSFCFFAHNWLKFSSLKIDRYPLMRFHEKFILRPNFSYWAFSTP